MQLQEQGTIANTTLAILYKLALLEMQKNGSLLLSLIESGRGLLKKLLVVCQRATRQRSRDSGIQLSTLADLLS